MSSRTSQEYKKEFEALENKQNKLRSDLINDFKRLVKIYPDNGLPINDVINSFNIAILSSNQLITYLQIIEKYIEDHAKYKQSEINFNNNQII